MQILRSQQMLNIHIYMQIFANFGYFFKYPSQIYVKQYHFPDYTYMIDVLSGSGNLISSFTFRSQFPSPRHLMNLTLVISELREFNVSTNIRAYGVNIAFAKYHKSLRCFCCEQIGNDLR